jgi:hypothetical protein
MNRVKLTTTTTGTGDLTFSTTPAARCLPLSSIPVGTMVRMMVEDENGTDWELMDATVTGLTTVSRGKTWNGSAGPGVHTNFGAGTKSAFVTAILVPTVIPFSATVPLDRPEFACMADYTLTGPLTLTAGANPVTGAHVTGTIIGNGVDTPAVAGFVKHSSSLPFNKAAGVRNIFQAVRWPNVSYYAFGQAAADVVATTTTPPTPQPTAVTMTGPTGGTTNTASGNFTVGTDVARSSAVVVTPTPVTGVTFTPTSVTLPAGSATATFTATATTTGAKTIAVTNDAGLTNPASITYTVVSSATVPGAPTIGTAVAGDGYIDVAFSAPASNGGSAILDYTATTSGGQTATGTTSPIRVTVPNGTAQTATVKARNTVGLSAASAASNSVTPAAATPTVQYPRMVDTAGSNAIETGPAPYDYVYSGVPMSGVFDLGFVNGQAGFFQFDTRPDNQTYSLSLVPAKGGTMASRVRMDWNGSTYGYLIATTSTESNPAVARANGDSIKIVWDGAGGITYQRSTDSGATWTNLGAPQTGITGPHKIQLDSQFGGINNVSAMGLA